MEKKKQTQVPSMGMPSMGGHHEMPQMGHHYEVPAMGHYGHYYYQCGCGNQGSFALIVVLFLLLIIVGTAYVEC